MSRKILNILSDGSLCFSKHISIKFLKKINILEKDFRNFPNSVKNSLNLNQFSKSNFKSNFFK